MKPYCIGILSLLVLTTNLSAQSTVKMSAVKANNYGVSYTLPKTNIVVKADASKTTRKVGEFYEYAERYLNITNPITANEVIHSITNITATTTGTPDKEKSYLVEFRSGTTSPFVTLTKEGILCAINAEAEVEPTDKDVSKITTETKKEGLNPNKFLSEETLRAGSKARQAELIAKQIFKLRESKSNILTGEADNMPPDGNAYRLVIEQIDEQEKALTSLFIGSETTEYISKAQEIILDDKNLEKQILFRFSKKLGFVDSDDLAGAAVTIDLTNKNPIPEPPLLSPKEQKEVEKKFSEGIIYNIPGKADLKINYANKTWVNITCEIVQYGTQEVLVSKMFENNKQPIKVIFFHNTGAIKQIIQ
ncbi:MAG: hypothetical protein RL662_1827 [Bacteroidota bacterium]|jgi:hypothetical protein